MFQREYKGVVFSLILGIMVLLVAPYITFTNSIILGLLVGIIINNFFQIPSSLSSGISFTSSKLLEFSVVLLAFGINYSDISQLGFKSFLIVITTLFLVLLVTIFLANKFKCPGSIGWLTGFGTAICGSSAIAALAPSVTKDKEDVGVAMAVVNLYGAIGMLLLPLLISYFEIDILNSGLLIGGSLHSVGNVAGAGYAVSDVVGEQALTIKLARVAMLTPALIVFNIVVSKNKENRQSWFSLPWYLILFLIISTLVSFVDIPLFVVKNAALLGKWFLTIAMVAIGLKIKFKSLISTGKKGLMFGLVIFAIQLTVLGLLILVF